MKTMRSKADRRAVWFVAYALVLVRTMTVVGSDSVEDRVKYLGSISATEKDELRRRQERFEKLSTEEQEKLRKLEETLANDPRGEQLRQVMLRYNEWLSALPSSQRTEIMNAPAAERVELVKK